MYFSAALSSENDHGSMNLASSAPFRVLLQSHAWPSAILVDELDAGSFKSPSNNINGSAARLIRSRLELVNSHDPNTRFRCKVLLAPIQERARGPALLWRDHNGRQCHGPAAFTIA
jgi:hypothetical protein